MKKLSGIQIARRISLGFFLTLVTVFTILHLRIAGFPSIDGLCPFGGIETLYAYVAGGQLIQNIQPGNIVLLAAITVLGIVLARFFCGWICALGTLQGIFGWIGAKLFRRRFNLPAKLDSVLRYLKYVVLALILVFTWQAGSLVIRNIDPWVAYGHITADWTELWGQFAVGLVILIASLVLSLFSDRVFCKYVCPLGAVNAILGRIPLFRIKRQESSCTSCQLCTKQCPMNIPVATLKTITSPECISCFECVSNCPTKKGTLRTTLAGHAVKTGWVIVAGLGIYGLSVGVGHLLGMARFGPASLHEQELGGKLKITDIKGSASWGEIAASFKVDLHELMKDSGIDPAVVPPETKLKETAKLSGKADFTPDTARFALAKMLGVAYAGESGTGMSEGAKEAGEAHNNEAAATLTVPADFELEGTMTIQDVASAFGVSTTQVIAKLKLPADIPVDKILKELRSAYNFSMPDLKVRIHE